MPYSDQAQAVGAAADAEIAGLQKQLVDLNGQLSAAADQNGRLAASVTDREATIYKLQRQLEMALLGPDWVRYEDLVQLGDVDITDVLAHLSTPKFVLMPAGRFEFSDFARTPGTKVYGGVSYPTGCGAYISKMVRGLRGAGVGSTVLALRAGSSTKTVQPQAAGGTTGLTALQAGGGALELLEGFTLDVGAQGHRCHGLSVFNSKVPVTLRKVQVLGSEGDNGAPPGETFAITVHGGTGNLVEDVTVDGRDDATVGITLQDCVGGRVVRPKVTGCRGGQIVLYESVGTTIEDMELNKTTARPVSGSILNLEQTAGTVLVRPKLLGGIPKKSVHVSHSNNQDSISLGGSTYSFADGSLTIQDPIFTDLWPTSSGTVPGLLTIETWGTDGATLNKNRGVTTFIPGVHYYADKPAGMHTAPLVTGPDGSPIIYDWVRYGTHNKKAAPYTVAGE